MFQEKKINQLSLLTERVEATTKLKGVLSHNLRRHLDSKTETRQSGTIYRMRH